MGWFNEKLNDQNKSLVSDLVAAYTERSRLTFRLLSLEPQLTDMQMAVLWLCLVVIIEKDREETKKPEMTETLAQWDEQWHSISREFLDSFCQDYVTQVVGSPLTLEVHSTIIQENISTTIDAMPPQLRTDAGTIISELGVNALALSSATLAVLRSGFKKDQRTSLLRNWQHRLSLPTEA